MTTWVYLFDEVAKAGVPVPPGFTVTTEACNEFRKTGRQIPQGPCGTSSSPR
jgi:phosphoenolpyruvate synthase/pyruvate phosphate dikinase